MKQSTFYYLLHRGAFGGGGASAPGALDGFKKPAVAFSFQKLFSDYSGACINVRRTGGDTLDIGFDSEGNLNLQAIADFCTTGNGRVVTFYDQSGNGRHLEQAVGGDQPFIYQFGAQIIDPDTGKPALAFDSDQTIRMRLASPISVTGLGGSYFVGKASYDGSYSSMVTGFDDITNNTRGYVFSGAIRYVFSPYKGTTVWGAPASVADLRAQTGMVSIIAEGEIVDEFRDINVYWNSEVLTPTSTNYIKDNIIFDTVGSFADSAPNAEYFSEWVLWDVDVAAELADIQANRINHYSL